MFNKVAQLILIVIIGCFSAASPTAASCESLVSLKLPDDAANFECRT